MTGYIYKITNNININRYTAATMQNPKVRLPIKSANAKAAPKDR